MLTRAIGLRSATPQGATQVWLPTRCINSNWHQPLQNGFKPPINAKAIKD